MSKVRTVYAKRGEHIRVVRPKGSDSGSLIGWIIGGIILLAICG